MIASIIDIGTNSCRMMIADDKNNKEVGDRVLFDQFIYQMGNQLGDEFNRFANNE